MGQFISLCCSRFLSLSLCRRLKFSRSLTRTFAIVLPTLSLSRRQIQWHSTAALALGLMQKETLSLKCADPIKN